MRIAHLLLTSRFAGSERYAIELAAGQAEAGHEVTLLLRRAALADRADAPGRHLPPSLPVVALPDWLPGWHARRWLRRHRPEVAHAHLSAACKALRGLDGMVRVATLHIAYKPGQHAHLDGLVALTPAQRATLPPAFAGRSVQIDNWTRARPAPPGAREQLRARLGIGADVRLLGTLGRVEDSKGHDLLLAAFAAAGFGKDVQLVVVGGGGALAGLRRRAPPGVHFTGFSTEPEAWLAAMDGFVSAARSEPFGLVFLEAMAAGLPILATATEGGRHLGPRFGTPLVPVGDAAALAAALRAFVAGGLARRDYPMDGFRLDAQLPRFEAFYRRLQG
ncbi:MAG: glycosyltransferase family 4 protein [Xanthomonadaceae bacterium]|jgi:glycosyltransferase involved in cell wall biosynthesis|nr:glycosyltransferase family 4 protein [Xanthomonadaceae bacterium]